MAPGGIWYPGGLAAGLIFQLHFFDVFCL